MAYTLQMKSPNEVENKIHEMILIVRLERVETHQLYMYNCKICTYTSMNISIYSYYMQWLLITWSNGYSQDKSCLVAHLTYQRLSCLFQNGGPEVKKKLEEVRVLESRKSARLLNQGNTDFSKLADFNIVHERRRINSETSDISGTRWATVLPLY